MRKVFAFEKKFNTSKISPNTFETIHNLSCLHKVNLEVAEASQWICVFQI